MGFGALLLLCAVMWDHVGVTPTAVWLALIAFNQTWRQMRPDAVAHRPRLALAVVAPRAASPVAAYRRRLWRRRHCAITRRIRRTDSGAGDRRRHRKRRIGAGARRWPRAPAEAGCGVRARIRCLSAPLPRSTRSPRRKWRRKSPPRRFLFSEQRKSRTRRGGEKGGPARGRGGDAAPEIPAAGPLSSMRSRAYFTNDDYSAKNIILQLLPYGWR